MNKFKQNIFNWGLISDHHHHQKDPQTTVVQNLIAQTVNSVMKSGRAGHLGTGSYEPIPRDVMRLQSWEIPESLIYHEVCNFIRLHNLII